MGGIVMNENIDLTKILDGCPYGTEFYHTGYGRVWLAYIYPDAENVAYPIELSLHENSPRRFDLGVTARGTFHYEYEGECLLLPSKDQRDWSKFVRFWDKQSLDKPVTEKFDPKTLHEWDKILVRKVHSPFNISPWSCEYFSYINPNTPHLVNGIASRYEICIPYNDETKHLRGTTDDCPEYYKWWKLEKGFWWEED